MSLFFRLYHPGDTDDDRKKHSGAGPDDPRPIPTAGQEADKQIKGGNGAPVDPRYGPHAAGRLFVFRGVVPFLQELLKASLCYTRPDQKGRPAGDKEEQTAYGTDRRQFCARSAMVRKKGTTLKIQREIPRRVQKRMRGSDPSFQTFASPSTPYWREIASLSRYS